MSRSLVTLLGLLTALPIAAAACGEDCSEIDCGACPPPITLEIVGADTSGAVDGVTVTGAPASCAVDAARDLTRCDLHPSQGSGTVTVEVSAPGYQSQSVEAWIQAYSLEGGSCCDCGYDPNTVSVTLSPL